jgi:hypothetical protein
MLKKELIDLVKDAAGLKYSDRTVMHHIGIAFEQVIGQIFRQNPGQLDFFTKDYTVPVVHVPPRPYSTLPERIIQFSDTSAGVRRILYLDNDDIDFVPVPAYYFQLEDNLDVGSMDSSVGYYVRSSKIEYSKSMPLAVKEVRMELVIPFSQYSDNEDFPFPAGAGENVIAMALSTLKSEVPETNVNKPAKK